MMCFIQVKPRPKRREAINSPRSKVVPLPRRIKFDSWIFLGSILLLGTTLIRRSHGFANNLIVTKIGCMTELDTSEVIMNNVVKAAEASDFRDMHLAILDENQELHHEALFVYRPDPGTTTATVTVVFVNPYSVDDFPEKNDLQFIIQLEDTSGGAPGVSAAFVRGGTIGCDGNQRVSARYKDDEGQVQLQIHDVSASFKLWAGWATGQHAVRLTPTLVLEPGSEDEEPETVEEDHLTEVAKKGTEEKINVAEEKGPGGNGPGAGDQKQLADEPDLSEQEGRDQYHTKEKHRRWNTAEALQKTRDMEKDQRRNPPSKKHRTVPKDRAGTENDNTHLFDEESRRKDLEAEKERNYPIKRSFVRRYERGVELDSTSHLVASIFFLLSIGSIVFFFGKRRSKGHLL